MKPKKFKIIQSDMDYTIAQRYLVGRMTKLRYKIISSYCRRNSQSFGNCGHQHDCCGCLSSQYFYFEYKHNRAVITIATSYNY